jgi:hypothetical protein
MKWPANSPWPRCEFTVRLCSPSRMMLHSAVFRCLITMDIAVRRASLSEDREELIAVLERNFPGPAKQFRWRHEDNPAGPGWSWIAYDRQSGAVSAMASVFPRRMYRNGKPVLCGQVGEFAVDKNYRSLGPALMLQRATFQPVDSGDLAFCYDCPPHDQGMATFVRLGMLPMCEITRYTYLLRSDELVKSKFGDGRWTKALTLGTNVLLGMRPSNREALGLEICRLEGEFGDEFTYLDELVPSFGMLRASRSADLLNWRFYQRADPNVSHTDILVARRCGELLAFVAILAYSDGRATISDLFGQHLGEIGLPLLAEAITRCRQQNLSCVDAYCADKSDLRALLRAAGFYPRERAARVVAYGASNNSGGALWSMGQAEVHA